MPTKIRLQRKGKKGQPFYHLVVADGRAPRDGKFIERLGTYNPMTQPSTITLNFERSLYWVQVGAQPTDTARSILSNKGVMLKHHLLKGVQKGALTEEQAEEKFQAWLKEKEDKIEQNMKDEMLSEKEKAKIILEEERKINEARAAELAKKRAKENLKVEEAAAARKEEAEAQKEKAQEAVADKKEETTPKEEAPKEEAPKEEAPKEEAPKKEVTKEEAPKEEVTKEEAPKEEASKKEEEKKAE